MRLARPLPADHKGHNLVEFQPLNPEPGRRYYRCTRCKGKAISHPGVGILDSNLREREREAVYRLHSAL